MSEWKTMNRMISSIWGKLEEKRDQRKLIKYKNWCATVDKKCGLAISYLKLLDGADIDKKEKISLIISKVITGINEVIALLATTQFKNDTSIASASTSLQDNIRTTLLDMWSPLLLSLAKLELIDVMGVGAVHKAVLLLMCREEFSCECLAASITPTNPSMPSSSPSASTPPNPPLSPKEIAANKEIITRYRAMLLLTLQTATNRIIDKPNIATTGYSPAANSMNNLSFASKVLAILYWRLPHVGQAISKILEIPDVELLAPVLSFPAFPDETPPPRVAGVHRGSVSSPPGSSRDTTKRLSSEEEKNDASNTSAELTEREDSRDSGPPSSGLRGWLTGWTDLYKELPPIDSAQMRDNGPWLAVLGRFDATYIAFFKEWILHVKYVLGKVEWTSIPGFPRLLQSLLYQMRTKEQPPPPLSKPYPLLELQYLLLEQTKAELIDAFIKAAFLRTNAFDLLSVLNTLHLIEGWFSEMMEHDLALPPAFDINFFCTGLYILLQSDHHQTLLRVISLIYSFSDMFDGAHRVALFNLLLTKKFFALFLHWDPGVRNAYHQLLIFKMVRIKRSTLYSDGYVVKEMAKVGVTTHNARESVSEPQSNPLIAFVNRTGSGFFSSLSALPAIFSLSAAPSTPASSYAPTSTTPSTANEFHGVNNTESSCDADDPRNRPPTPMPTSPLDQAVASPNKAGPSTSIKMGISRTNSGSSLANGDISENGREEGQSSSSSSTDNSGNKGSGLEVDSYGMKGSPNSSPAVTLCDDESASIDVQLFLKLNSFLKIIEDQVRKPTLKKTFDQGLESYAPYALAEFNQHLARYHQWELKNEEPPRLLSLPFLRMGEG